jgi:hypothetical protein
MKKTNVTALRREIRNLKESNTNLLMRKLEVQEDIKKYKQFCTEIVDCMANADLEKKSLINSYWIKRSKDLWA